jgi:hypothetical protein
MRDMKLTVFLAGAFIGLASIVAAQGDTQTTTTTQTETKYVTVDGEVVRYDQPSRVIVIRGKDKKEVTYMLAPSATVPTEVQVGRRVVLYTEPGADGSTQLVQRVTTTAVTAEGATKRTTEETRTSPSGVTTRTTTTTVSGKVEAYEPGKTLTIIGSNGSKVTYYITDKSKVPADLVVGKTVTILPLSATSSSGPVAQTITVIKTEEVPEH